MIRWNEKARILWLARPDAALEAKLNASYERVPGKLHWRVPPDGKVTLARTISMVKSVLSSKLDPGDPIVLKRIESCTPCDALKKDAKGAWCQTCGCGSERLMLSPDGAPIGKMLNSYLECPKFMPGFSNGGAT